MGTTLRRPPRETLYKYRPDTGRAIRDFRLQRLYFSPPRDFNDPYDCLTPPSLPDLTEEQFNPLREAYKKTHGEYPSEGISPEMFVNFGNECLKRMHELMREYIGVACFSEAKDILPMWSHYANDGRGFCLAFDTRHSEMFAGARIIRVEYSQHIPNIDVYQAWRKGVAIAWHAHKSMDWAHEKEWRALKDDRECLAEMCKIIFNAKPTEDVTEHLHAVAKAKLSGTEKYCPEAVKAVYLGVRIAEEKERKIRSIIQEKYPHAELWKARLKQKKQYEMEFIPQNYAAQAAQASP